MDEYYHNIYRYIDGECEYVMCTWKIYERTIIGIIFKYIDI